MLRGGVDVTTAERGECECLAFETGEARGRHNRLSHSRSSVGIDGFVNHAHPTSKVLSCARESEGPCMRSSRHHDARAHRISPVYKTICKASGVKAEAKGDVHLGTRAYLAADVLAAKEGSVSL